MAGNLWPQIKRAFTLVELLVVLGIVLVLMAIILPVLGKARNAANSAACMSNLRTLSIGYTDYCSTTPHMNQGWLYDYGMWLAEFAPLIGNPGTPTFDSKIPLYPPTSPVTYVPYFSPAIQKLAICPASNLPQGLTIGDTLANTPAVAFGLPDGNTNFGIGSGSNNAFNPTVADLGVYNPNSFLTWAVGDPSLNGGNWFFGSYGFNVWLYNSYGTQSVAAAGTHSVTSSSVLAGIPDTQANVMLSLMSSPKQFMTAVQANNPNIQFASGLLWWNLGEKPSGQTPVFFDSAWTETAPTYLDPPAPGGSLPAGTGNQMTNNSSLVGGSSLIHFTGFQDYSGSGSVSSSQGSEASSTPGMYNVCINRHDMTVNVGFADGHAENVSLGNLWTLDWSATPPTPNGASQIILSP